MDVPTEAIYEALLDDDAFAQLPELMARIANARSAVMHWRHHDGDYEVMGHSYFSQAIIDMTPEVLPIDPWTNTLLRRPNEFVNIDALLPPRFFENSPAFKKLFFNNGDDTTRAMGMVISSGHGSGVLGVHRGRTQASFGTEDEARLAASIHHFRRVMLLRGELSAGRRAEAHAQALIDSLSVVIIAVRANRRIVSTNAAAQVVLERNDGLIVRAGVLSAASPASAAQLAQAVERAAAPRDPSSTSVCIVRGPERDPYLVTVAPMPAGAGATAALLVFRDPEVADSGLTDRLRSLFGLTAAEASVAMELGRGRGVSEMAVMRGVSPHTLRVQIKAVAAKMGVARQSEIAAIVAALPPVRG